MGDGSNRLNHILESRKLFLFPILVLASGLLMATPSGGYIYPPRLWLIMGDGLVTVSRANGVRFVSSGKGVTPRTLKQKAMSQHFKVQDYKE